MEGPKSADQHSAVSRSRGWVHRTHIAWIPRVEEPLNKRLQAESLPHISGARGGGLDIRGCWSPSICGIGSVFGAIEFLRQPGRRFSIDPWNRPFVDG